MNAIQLFPQQEDITGLTKEEILANISEARGAFGKAVKDKFGGAGEWGE